MTQASSPAECGCCEGVHKLTPASIVNPPGLSAISYRVGTFSKFLKSMVANLEQAPNVTAVADQLSPLSHLTTRKDNDLTISLFEAWAIVADILTFYQERIANEGFLRTATERISVLELARSIGYELRPGVAASTFLAFTIEDSPGAVSKTIISPGIKVQSLPLEGKNPPEVPQVFETISEGPGTGNFEAYPELNKMRPLSLLPQFTEQTAFDTLSSITLVGTNSGLQIGDGLLIAQSRDNNKIVPVAFKTIAGVVVDDSMQQTKVELVLEGGQLDDFSTASIDTPLSNPVTSNIIDKKQLISDSVAVRDIISKGMNSPQLNAAVAERGWAARDFVKTANSIPYGKSPGGVTKVYALRTRTGFFGNNAQPWNTLPPNLTTNGPYSWDWDPVWPINWDSQRNPYDANTGTTVYLESAYPSVHASDAVSVSWIILTGRSVFANNKIRTCAYYITNVREETRADFMMSARATRLELAVDKGMVQLDENHFTLRETTVYVQSEELQLAYLTNLAPIEESESSITLDRFVAGLLRVGQPIAITGKPKSGGDITSEVVFITGIIPSAANPVGAYVTSIQFTPSLINSYQRETVIINANVCQSTHGETKTEIIGSGGEPLPYLELVLKAKPLTYVAASTPSGVSSTLEIRINDILWKEVPSLYSLDPADRSYITRRDDDGKTRVIFGNSRPTRGTENVKAKYRVGIGTAGLLAAGQLNLLLSKPLGLRGVTNPIATTGAADPESLDSGRQNAPLRVLTLNRIVSLKDVENFALAFAGIGKALAVPIWNGGRRRVKLIIAGISGATVDTSSKTYESLLGAIGKSKDPQLEVKIDSYTKKLFNIQGRLIITKDMDSDVVRDNVTQALCNKFSFDARRFGQAVTRNELIRTMQDVRGVVAADVDFLYLSTEDLTTTTEIITAEISELLTLNPDPGAMKLMIEEEKVSA